MITELEAYRLLIRSCDYGININMNDTFYYACGDSEEVDNSDVQHLIPLIQRYGNDTLVAYAAIKRGHDPTINQHITDNFKAAKKELQEMFDKGELCWEKYHEMEELKKQMMDFGGQTITHSSFSDRFINILNKEPKVSRRVMHCSKLKDGTIAVGGSYHEMYTRLKRNYERRNKCKECPNCSGTGNIHKNCILR